MANLFHRLTLGFCFAAACFVIAGIGLGTYWSTHRLVRSFNSVAESHKAIEKLQSIQEMVQAEESSAYNYVITGNESRLNVYLRSNKLIPRYLRDVETLVKGNARQASALKQFRRLYTVHQDYLAKIVTERKENGFEAASQWVTAEDDRSVRDVLRVVLAEVQKEQGKVLRKRSASSSIHSAEIKYALAAAASIIFLLVGAVFMWLRRERGGRYEAETTNIQLETFLRSIVERIPYMVLVKEARTLRLTLVNKAATEWLGHTEEELLGSNEYDLRPAEAARLAMQQDREVIQNGTPVDIPEEVLLGKGQEERILHTQKVSIPDQDGNPAFLLTISEDITQRKKAERVLQMSRDAAVQSERLKSEFIRNMSHEIRTPLSIVVGMMSILLDSSLTPEQRGFAVKVDRAANNLAKLTKSILDFSKIESGTFAVEMQEMNLRQTIDGIMDMLREQAKTKGVGLVSLVPPQIPQTLVGDPIRLRQVLTELITNALKFTERGEIIVRVVAAEQVDEEQQWLTIKVTDTGPGISEDVQKHLFEPFRQGDGSPTRRFGGTGLGLAISKKIVELMGGKIGFSSELKEGSTFWCTIPFKKLVGPGHLGKVTSMPWTRARILVIDENAITRQMLCNQLKAWSLASEWTASGEMALNLLRNEKKAGRPFQLVLLSMHLIDMEGVVFAKRVKEEADLTGLQLVVFADNSVDATTAASLGFASCIPTPINAETLYDRLTFLIESSTKVRQSAA